MKQGKTLYEPYIIQLQSMTGLADLAINEEFANQYKMNKYQLSSIRREEQQLMGYIVREMFHISSSGDEEVVTVTWYVRIGEQHEQRWQGSYTHKKWQYNHETQQEEITTILDEPIEYTANKIKGNQHVAILEHYQPLATAVLFTCDDITFKRKVQTKQTNYAYGKLSKQKAQQQTQSLREGFYSKLPNCIETSFENLGSSQSVVLKADLNTSGGIIFGVGIYASNYYQKRLTYDCSIYEMTQSEMNRIYTHEPQPISIHQGLNHHVQKLARFTYDVECEIEILQKMGIDKAVKVEMRNRLALYNLGVSIIDYYRDVQNDASAVVVRDNDTRELIVAYTGTGSIKDWVTDIRILSRGTNKHLPSALYFIDKIQRRYLQSGETLIVCGHSLGGALALTVAQHRSALIKYAIGFNSAPIAIRDFVADVDPNLEQYVLYCKGDPLTNLVNIFYPKGYPVKPIETPSIYPFYSLVRNHSYVLQSPNIRQFLENKR